MFVMLDPGIILFGEIRCWSLLGIEVVSVLILFGLTSVTRVFRSVLLHFIIFVCNSIFTIEVSQMNDCITRILCHTITLP